VTTDKPANHKLVIAQRYVPTCTTCGSHVDSGLTPISPKTSPLALILVSLAELNGAPTALVHCSLAALFALRVVSFFAASSPAPRIEQAHVEFGLKLRNTLGPGRAVGALGTLALISLAGAYSTPTRLFDYRAKITSAGRLYAGVRLCSYADPPDLSLSERGAGMQGRGEWMPIMWP
jgi:hypothetical protein